MVIYFLSHTLICSPASVRQRGQPGKLIRRKFHFSHKSTSSIMAAGCIFQDLFFGLTIHKAYVGCPHPFPLTIIFLKHFLIHSPISVTIEPILHQIRRHTFQRGIVSSKTLLIRIVELWMCSESPCICKPCYIRWANIL